MLLSLVHLSRLDFWDIFSFFYVPAPTIDRFQRQSFNILPNPAGHIKATPCFSAKNHCPKPSSPFPSIQIAFQIKEETKRKRLFIWGNIIFKFKTLQMKKSSMRRQKHKRLNGFLKFIQMVAKLRLEHPLFVRICYQDFTNVLHTLESFPSFPMLETI